MDSETLNQAKEAYAAHDYETALERFTACLSADREHLASGEIGMVYHQIGNSLVKLKDYNEAIHAYSQATADSAYDAVGSVNYDLGMCYAVLHDYGNAVKYFEIAVSDARYDTAYKAYNGMGKALLKLGKNAEAGAAFRSAALDDDNPNPTNALLNLGICFMALDRPADAAVSYESALQFDMKPETRNKLQANLGQAYVASNQMQKAVSAFEAALADKTYYLNDSASVDYQRAIGAVSTGTAIISDQPLVQENDMSGLDVPVDDSPLLYSQDDPSTTAANPYYFADQVKVDDKYASGGDRFLNATDEELEAWSKGVAKEQRKHHHTGIKVFFIILIVAVIGAAGFLYYDGYGYPTQEMETQQLFSDPNGSSALFASSVASDDVSSMEKLVVQTSSVTINGVDRSMTSSAVYCSAATSKGGTVNYKISFVRDLAGWKISDVELYFTSQNS